MPDYRKMYFSLFNDVADVIVRLQQAQRKTEQMFVEGREPELTILQQASSEDK
jgi:hypothetical protein